MQSSMIELMRQRRSIRRFSSLSIEPEKIALLKEASLRSPTSRNINPWRFIFVDSFDLISKLAVSKQHGSTFLEGAPLAIVVIADETQSDVWVEDCSIASILLQMTAQSLGLGSCWIQIRNRPHNHEVTADQYIHSLLDIPDTFRVESIIAVGYPNEIKSPIEMNELDHDKIFHNKFGRL